MLIQPKSDDSPVYLNPKRNKVSSTFSSFPNHSNKNPNKPPRKSSGSPSWISRSSPHYSQPTTPSLVPLTTSQNSKTSSISSNCMGGKRKPGKAWPSTRCKNRLSFPIRTYWSSRRILSSFWIWPKDRLSPWSIMRPTWSILISSTWRFVKIG